MPKAARLNHFGSKTKTIQSRGLRSPISSHRRRNRCYILEMRFRMSIRETRQLPEWRILKCAIQKNRRHLMPPDSKPRSLRLRLRDMRVLPEVPRTSGNTRISRCLATSAVVFEHAAAAKTYASAHSQMGNAEHTCPWQHLGCPFSHKLKAQITRHMASCKHNPHPVLQKCDRCEDAAYTRINRLFEHN